MRKRGDIRDSSRDARSTDEEGDADVRFEGHGLSLHQTKLTQVVPMIRSVDHVGRLEQLLASQLRHHLQGDADVSRDAQSSFPQEREGEREREKARQKEGMRL